MKHDKTHYQVLGLQDQDASPVSIKQAYLTLVLKHHPDKRGGRVMQMADTPSDTFLGIQRAWETLRDPQSRLRYDLSLCSQGRIIHEEVSLSDMTFHPGSDGGLVTILEEETQSDYYTYPCRCGQPFTLLSEWITPPSSESSVSSEIVMEQSLSSSSIQLDQREEEDRVLLLPCAGCSLALSVALPPPSATFVQETE